MPAKSAAQQALFAIAEKHPEKLHAENKSLASLSHQTLHDFAATPSKNLPQHVGRKYYADGDTPDQVQPENSSLIPSAPGPWASGYVAPPAAPELGSDQMLTAARAKYPFIGSNVVAVPKTGGGFGSEGWPAGETGDPSYPRPKQIPLNSPGIEYDPKGNIDDLAGEVLHTDQFANDVRDRMSKTFSPDQINYLAHEALDYGAGTNTPPDVQLRNGTDSFIRGALLNQWPAKAVSGMNLTPQQQALLGHLKTYMTTGQKPTLDGPGKGGYPPPSSRQYYGR